MPFHEDILSDLPAPHEAEPSTLRRDILDELKDHLQSAARREFLKTSNPEEAQRNVLAKFGDPRKIARKLWFDAMKEKLMLQKITLGLVSLVAVASLAACGLMFSMARDFQSASTELLSRSEEANAKLLKQNQEMMQQLTALANRPVEAAPSMDWNPLKIRVVKNDGDKTPGERFTVTVIGPHISQSEETRIDKETDENGVADFSSVRPGEFKAAVTAPWGEGHHFSFQVQPGEAYEQEIIAPAGPPEPIQVKPVVEWPEEFEGLDVAVLAKFDSRDWTQKAWTGGGSVYLLIRPDGRFAVYDYVSRGGSDLGIISFSFGSTRRPEYTSLYDVVHFTAGRRRKTPLEQFGQGKVYRNSFPWRGKEPYLERLDILKLPKAADFPKDGESLKRLAPADYFFSHRSLQSLPNPIRNIYSIETVDHAEVVNSETRDDGEQTWSITIPSPYVLVTKTMLAPEQFPDLSDRVVVLAALAFSLTDKDSSDDLSEEELKNSVSNKARWLKFQEHPVSFKTFVEAFVSDPSGTF